jgi:protocatechuate 3,4-dioxygenase beta subunit
MKKSVIILFSILPILSQAQDEVNTLEKIESQINSRSKSISEILMDPSYMKLHSLTSFREIIKKNAKQEKVTLVNKNEPGTPVTIRCKLNSNRSVDNLLIYVYHTDNRGWYSDTAAHVLIREGDRGHARLFGYLRSDKNGQFEFATIHPQGYPKSDLPQHIHLEIFDQSGRNLLITELLFDDDARLQGETRRSASQAGFIIAKNEGKGNMQVYTYNVSLR